MASTKKHEAVTGRPVIRFAEGLREKVMGSVGRLEPEHYGVLAGDLDDPFHVREFFPMPPATGSDGRPLSSAGHVTLNAPYLEYLLNTSLLPFGMYFLGVMHSHPGNMTRLSGGVAGSGQGDIPSMRSQLENAQRLGVIWENYLAPIVTRPGDDPELTGWVIRLDRPDPIPADIIFETEGPANAGSGLNYANRDKILENLLAQLDLYQNRINLIGNYATAPEPDREFAAAMLRRLRVVDMAALETEILRQFGRR